MLLCSSHLLQDHSAVRYVHLGRENLAGDGRQLQSGDTGRYPGPTFSESSSRNKACLKMYESARFRCDNKVVVSHRNHPHWKKRWTSPKRCNPPVPKTYTTSRATVSIHHVYGHMDEVLRHNQLPYDKMINCLADQLANYALAAGIASGRFISSNFPF